MSVISFSRSLSLYIISAISDLILRDAIRKHLISLSICSCAWRLRLVSGRSVVCVPSFWGGCAAGAFVAGLSDRTLFTPWVSYERASSEPAADGGMEYFYSVYLLAWFLLLSICGAFVCCIASVCVSLMGCSCVLFPSGEAICEAC